MLLHRNLLVTWVRQNSVGVLDDLNRALAGLTDVSRNRGMASPTLASWNQIVSWLRQIDGLRQAA